MLNQKVLKDIVYYNDGKLFWNISKQKIKKDEECGYTDSYGYRNVVINGKNYKTHRLIYLYHYGVLPDFIDHIDGNPSNNHIDNLRPCTRQQNNYNSKMPKSNSSGIKGVDWYKPNNKWRAQCRVNGKKKHIGYFIDIKDAELVVIKFRENNHGEYLRNE